MNITRSIVFIGEMFYRKSGTIMSSLYEIINGEFYRTDWGKVQIALENGNKINIRPATKQEIKYFNAELKRMK
jgi:hypothetical protein